MRNSEHYNLNLVEGTDKMNPLVQDVPNYEKIDEQMYKNSVASIGLATELKTGTVHNLTRENDSAPMIRFTATSRFNVGDTFTVDGVQVTALMVDGSTLDDGCYIIGSVVICSLVGSVLTFYGLKTKASDAEKLGGELPEYYASASGLQSVNEIATAGSELASTTNTSLNSLIAKLNPEKVNLVTGVDLFRYDKIRVLQIVASQGNLKAIMLDTKDRPQITIATNCRVGAPTGDKWYMGGLSVLVGGGISSQYVPTYGSSYLVSPDTYVVYANVAWIVE